MAFNLFATLAIIRELYCISEYKSNQINIRMEKENQKAAEQAHEAYEAQMTAEEEAQAIVDNNLRFYSQGCEVPQDALKKIQAGRLRGMSDVNPMWRMKRMTEIFGPVGFGWKYEIVRQWTEVYGEEVKCFCNLNLYVRDPETKEWSSPIPGNGGSSIVSKEKGGCYVNDEGYKMALTDALSIAMKPLGIGGNIWYGPKATGHNESKYEAATREDQGNAGQPAKPVQAAMFTGEQLKSAIAEISAAKSEDQFSKIWKKWASVAPALCNNGTEFYKAACERINKIRNTNNAAK